MIKQKLREMADNNNMTNAKKLKQESIAFKLKKIG